MSDMARDLLNVRFTPKADIDRVCRNVRFVPKADSCSAAKSIERSDDFIDQRLHVEVIGWRNADTATGFFDHTGNDRPNGGYFCPQQTLSQRLFGLICLCH